jgi:hypothetical protein
MAFLENLHPEQFQNLEEFQNHYPTIYHGSPDNTLKVGDVIKPWGNLPPEERAEEARKYPNQNAVYGTNNYKWAHEIYASIAKANQPDLPLNHVAAVYEVEPLGALQRFTDDSVYRGFKEQGDEGTFEYSAPAWKIKKVHLSPRHVQRGIDIYGKPYER